MLFDRSLSFFWYDISQTPYGILQFLALNPAGSIKIPDNVSAELLLELSTLPAATITQEFR